MSADKPLPDAAKHLGWLLGKWRTAEGKPATGSFPTIKDFVYHEEAEFFHVGQPMLQFTLYARDAATSAPMHREVGFLRIKPGTRQIAWTSAQNTGLCDVEEGVVMEQTLTLQTVSPVGRMSFGKEPHVKQIRRIFERHGDCLTQSLYMETSTQPLKLHLEAHYVKAE